MKVACAFDHAGVPLRGAVLDAVRDAGHQALDLGDYDDYPDAVFEVAGAVHAGSAERGVIVCGSSAGVCVAANKLPGIRAGVGHDHYTAGQCVSHDHCNVLCLGARVIGPAIASEGVAAFLAATYSEEPRHLRRLQKVDAMETDHFAADLKQFGDNGRMAPPS
jgi:ribose 5-phosphate isomerase B